MSTSLFITWIYVTTALGFLRQDLTIYLQQISANLFFQIMNKDCSLERGQLLIILIEEMPKIQKQLQVIRQKPVTSAEDFQCKVISAG